jgi:hypothetical protein
MEPTIPNKKLEPGVYQGTPDASQTKTADSSPRIIRTMKSDVAEAIKKQNETSVSIAIAEEKKQAKARADALAVRQTQSESTPPAPKRIGRVVIVLIIVLIVLLSALAYIFILPKLGAIRMPSIQLSSSEKPSNANVAPVTHVVEPLAPSIIPAQSEKRINIGNNTLSQVVATIVAERANGNPAGSIKNLYFTENQGDVSVPLTTDRLFDFGNIQTPNILTRSLEKQFMAGFFGEENGGATPFLILKVSDYSAGFAGMLEWELILPGVFDTVFETNIGGDITARFHDITVTGKDARLFDTPSGAKIAYAFADKNTIVITGSRAALEALLPLATTK